MASKADETIPEQTPLEVITSEAGITIQDLDKECTEHDLLGLAKFCDPWGLIASHLKLTKSEISAIDEDNRTVDEKRLAVLRKWWQKFAVKATYRRFVDALLSIGLVGDAFDVCKLVKPASRANQGPGLMQQFIMMMLQKVENDPMSFLAGPQNERVTQDLHDLEKNFKDVQTNFIKGLRCNDVSLGDLKMSLAVLPPSVRERNKELMDSGVKLMEASSVEVFMYHLNCYLDFLEPSLLQSIVDDHGDDKTKQMMLEYTKQLQSFRRRTKLCDFVGLYERFETPPGYKEVEIGLDNEWNEKTLEDLEHMRNTLSRQYWIIKKGRIGSIVVMYYIPETEMLELKELKIDLKSKGILWIMADGEYLIDLRVSASKVSIVFAKHKATDILHYISEIKEQDLSLAVQDNQKFLLPEVINFRFLQPATMGNVQVSLDGLTAYWQLQSLFGPSLDAVHGTIHGSKPLMGTAEFEIEVTHTNPLLERSGFQFGVEILTRTREKPEKTRSKQCCRFRKKLLKDLSNSPASISDFGCADYDSLKVGDRVGFQIADGGTLRFFYNGHSEGIAASNVYLQRFDLYPFAKIAEGTNFGIQITRAVIRVDPEVLTLKSLCLRVIGSCLKSEWDVHELPLPRELQEILKDYIPAYIMRVYPPYLESFIEREWDYK